MVMLGGVDMPSDSVLFEVALPASVAEATRIVCTLRLAICAMAVLLWLAAGTSLEGLVLPLQVFPLSPQCVAQAQIPFKWHGMA